MGKPRTCPLCNANPDQEHQPWCKDARERSATVEFQASIIDADQSAKRMAHYWAEGVTANKTKRLSGESWEQGYTIAAYVAERDIAHRFALWEAVWLETHDGYTWDDVPEDLRATPVKAFRGF